VTKAVDIGGKHPMRLGYQQTVIDTYAKVAFANAKKERRPLAPLKSWLDLEELTPTAAHHSEADQRGTKQRQSSRLWS